MTILVIFGNPDLFNVMHGTMVHGEKGDCLYFADDRHYKQNEDSLTLPDTQEKILLPVIQHDSNSDAHGSQLLWLRSAQVNYEPLYAGGFSHNGEFFETMKRLLAPSVQTSDAKKQISKFVGRYSERMVLKLIDELAGWTILHLIDEANATYEDMMVGRANDVNLFIGGALRNRSPRDYLSILEAQAVRFC